MGMNSAPIALNAIPERDSFVLFCTHQPSTKNRMVKPVGIATRTNAEKSFHPQTTKDIAAVNNRKMPRKINPWRVRSESTALQNLSRIGRDGGAAACMTRGDFTAGMDSTCT